MWAPRWVSVQEVTGVPGELTRAEGKRDSQGVVELEFVIDVSLLNLRFNF